MVQVRGDTHCVGLERGSGHSASHPSPNPSLSHAGPSIASCLRIPASEDGSQQRLGLPLALIWHQTSVWGILTPWPAALYRQRHFSTERGALGPVLGCFLCCLQLTRGAGWG